MRPTTLTATLESLVQIRRPVLIEGAPGLGKTQSCEQVARNMGWNGVDNRPDQAFGYLHIHGPTKQPEDFGMPVISAERDAVNFVVDGSWPVVGNDRVPERGIVCFDELPQMDNAQQKISANIIQQRELYGRKFKPGWSFVATGNRPKDKAGANRLLSHLRARMTTLEFEPHLDDWCQWALTNGVSPMIVAFLRFKPGQLFDDNDQLEIRPNPRAWAEGVSPVIGAVPPAAEYECIKGAVGEGAAGEFVAFVKLYRELPDPDLILKDPLKHPIPTGKPSVLYALTGALAHRAEPDNFDRVMQFFTREEMPPEFMVLMVRDAIARNPALQDTDTFVKWSIGPGAKVLLGS